MPVHLHAKHPLARSARSWRRGSALLECALMMTLAIPMLFGVTSIGIRLGRTLQATQLTRDVAHMYALGADFSVTGTQTIAAKLAQGFTLTSTGDTVLILSRVVKVYTADCTAASVSPCTNAGSTVFAHRLVLGNSSLRTSAFGTPPSQYIDSSGNISSTDYYKQTSLVASGFDSVLSLSQGQVAWLVEGFFPMPDLSYLNSGGGSGGFYVRYVF